MYVFGIHRESGIKYCSQIGDPMPLLNFFFCECGTKEKTSVSLKHNFSLTDGKSIARLVAVFLLCCEYDVNCNDSDVDWVLKKCLLGNFSHCH